VAASSLLSCFCLIYSPSLLLSLPPSLLPSLQAYTICWDMSTQRTPYNWADELYQGYLRSLSSYVQQYVCRGMEQSVSGREGGRKGGRKGGTRQWVCAHFYQADLHSSVLCRHRASILTSPLSSLPPSLPLDDHTLLLELSARWEQYKCLVKDYQRTFVILDRYYLRHNGLVALGPAGTLPLPPFLPPSLLCLLDLSSLCASTVLHMRFHVPLLSSIRPSLSFSFLHFLLVLKPSLPPSLSPQVGPSSGKRHAAPRSSNESRKPSSEAPGQGRREGGR